MTRRCLWLFALAWVLFPAAAPAAEVTILLPLGRTAYQTNEWIDVSVVRQADEVLQAGELTLTLAGEDGSQATFVFAVPSVTRDAGRGTTDAPPGEQPGQEPAEDAAEQDAADDDAQEGQPPEDQPEGAADEDAPQEEAAEEETAEEPSEQGLPSDDAPLRATEHLHVNGRLLRPGHYTIAVAADGATAKAEIDVFSHLRRTSFKLINWGRATGAQQLVEGEESLGFNLFYGNYGNDDEANFIRTGMDFMSNCTMSGGHQMDLRSECDWSDPLVTRGGTRRVVRRAFIDRTRPNVFGVHFYDEPGLTWMENETTGENGPHDLPPQIAAYRRAFGRDPLASYDVEPSNPQHVAEWRQWALWKLGFMDAAWKEAQFGVSYVRPDYLSVTQSQYGWTAFTDGYYFNVARSLPIVSGHGGYDDYGLGYFNPSLTLEMARARDFTRPCWYLPTWYANTPADRFRLEQNLAFITGIEGMTSPPDIDPFDPASKPAAEGVVESNKLMARLGTIFTTMPVTRPPVALLYSMSHNIAVQTADRSQNYAHANLHGQRLPLAYLAGKLIQQPFMAVVEEDILDGTLAAEHKAIVLTSITHLEPDVIQALEDFAADGGLVLATADCELEIDGATFLGITPDLPDAEVVRQLQAEGKYAETAEYTTVGKYIEGALPLAKAIDARLKEAGIRPVFECDQTGIVASRQAAGDVEYLFAVNATFDSDADEQNAIKPTLARLGFPNDGRALYEAIFGQRVNIPAGVGDTIEFAMPFGPGQMRVFARTTRPIGGISCGAPLVRRDFTSGEDPLAVDVSAALLDDQGGLLSGSVALEITLVDPLGDTRHTLYRATEQGVWRASLPLAANDPAGKWTLNVREMLGGTTDSATFELAQPGQCGAVAGATGRAVSFVGEEENVFRFFRVHQDVTLVVGTSEYDRPTAERLAESVAPWGVRCQFVDAAAVNKPRPLTEEEAATWVGMEYAGSGQIKAGAENPVALVGFDVNGPVVLIGNAEDNPLIAFLLAQRFLPYKPEVGAFPGAGRGYYAWQRDAVGAGQESIALIAHDAAGMDEAVGTLFEALSGIEPLTQFVQPARSEITPAATKINPPQAPLAWQVFLPDRALGIGLEEGKAKAVTADGSVFLVSATGEPEAVQRNLNTGEAQVVADEVKIPTDVVALAVATQHCPPDRIVKHFAPSNGRTAIGFWGGEVTILDPGGTVKFSQLFDADVTGLVWIDDLVVVGLSDGRLLALDAK